jgi:hypothetical protein
VKTAIPPEFVVAVAGLITDDPPLGVNLIV